MLIHLNSLGTAILLTTFAGTAQDGGSPPLMSMY